jgi:hypothetical protein
MPPKKSLEDNMVQIQAKLTELAEAQDAGQKGKIRTAINNIKTRFRNYTDAKQKKELDNRLSKLLEDEKKKKDKSPSAKEKRKKIKELINIIRKGQAESMDAPPQSEVGTPEDLETKVPIKGFESKTPTPESSSASSSGSSTPQEDQPLLQEQPKRGRGRPRKPRNPVGRPSNVQQLTGAGKQEQNIKSVIEKATQGKLPDELVENIQDMYQRNPVQQVQEKIQERKKRMTETKKRNKEEIEKKQRENKENREKEQQQQRQAYLQAQLEEEAQLEQDIITLEAQLTDNVNKAEEQGSNTQIITPDYLLRERPRTETVEMKKGVPPPNQRRQVNELMNDEVETVPDLINVNQNQIGINESTTRQREQDITSQENQLGFVHDQNKKRWEDQKRIMNERIEQMKREIDGPLQADLAGIRNINNPITASSMPDNSNYQNTTEDKRNIMIEYAQELQLTR